MICDTFMEQFWLQESLEATFLEIKGVETFYTFQRSNLKSAFVGGSHTPYKLT